MCLQLEDVCLFPGVFSEGLQPQLILYVMAPVDTDSRYARFSTSGFDEPPEEAGTRKGALNWGTWPSWRSWFHQGQEKFKLEHPTGSPSKGTIQVSGQWDCQGKLALWFYVTSDARTLRTKNTGLSANHPLHGRGSVDPENMPFGGGTGNSMQPLGARCWSGSGVWWWW